jgi:hypothetical protein
MKWDEVGGYLDQDWNPVALEINRRVRDKLDTYKVLDWGMAYAEVMEEDPTLARKYNDAIQVEVNRRTKEMMKTHPNLDYASAMTAVFRDDTLLYREYEKMNAVMAGNPGVNTSRIRALQRAESEIGRIADQKVAASEGRMTRNEAWRIVLTDRPDLARRFKEAW